MLKKIRWNSPVVLSFALISAMALLLNQLTGGWSNIHLFSVYRSSMRDPLFYARLFGHVLGHASISHYSSNMLLLLLVGPLLEEKYGSARLLEIIGLTAVITGIAHILFDGSTMLLGASGVVFAFILLSSVTGTKNGEIPLTMIIAAGIYLVQQIGQSMQANSVSELTHIIGGTVGAVYGMAMRPKRK